MRTFVIESDFIPLIQLLKAAHVAGSGGEAQRLVEMGRVMVNNNKESRKRAKIRPGDVISCNGKLIHVISKIAENE